jgi:DNA-binding NarL/FixJ family response regulator
MHLDWIVNPALTYALIAIGLALCLFLFVSLKRDLSAGEARCQKKLAALQCDWQAKLETLDGHWKELSQISNLLVPPPPPRSGLNLNKRSQALQMHRRGETSQDIADALGISLNEVELLVKVQQILLSSLAQPASRAAGS